MAIVGTRGASGYGLAVATEIAEELARAGVVVVSGLALGIDGAAHRLRSTRDGERGGPAIADRPRLSASAPAAGASDPARRWGTGERGSDRGPVGRPDFARRNRIIAGLAEAVVVVEAPDRSGALLTAAAATAIGRELYAVRAGSTRPARAAATGLIADQRRRS